MPAINFNSTPNLTKDGVEGWGSRLIFSQNYPQYMDLNYTNYFDAIPPNYIRGTLGLFPSNYWSQGRILRLKASMFYSGSGSRFNISTRLTDGSNTINCRQDNGNNHDFASNNTAYNVPVNLEITYVRTGDDNGFAISGFYQYEWGSYDGGGENSKVVYVPMNYVYGNLDFSSPTQITITIEDQPVDIKWLTIEELG